MRAPVGEVLEVARRAKGFTQDELADAAEITQAALSRYEHGLRTPEPEVLERIAKALGVTVDLLNRGDRPQGGIAVAAHMRRRATAKVSIWRTLEARLNMLRLHTRQLREEIELRAELQVPTFDPADQPPEDVARMLRAQWRIPVGPIGSLAAWMEAAGILIFDEPFGSAARVDGLSQWSNEHAIVMLNSSAPPDRKRLTLAHELGHLVLHATYINDEMEEQANLFAAELLVPAEEVKPMMRGHLTLARFVDLKRYWGVSVQMLIERANRIGAITPAERTSLYKQLSARGWRTNEPGNDDIVVETPRLAAHIANSLKAKGLSELEIAHVAGFSSPADNTAFVPERGQRHLRPV